MDSYNSARIQIKCAEKICPDVVVSDTILFVMIEKVDGTEIENLLRFDSYSVNSFLGGLPTDAFLELLISSTASAGLELDRRVHIEMVAVAAEVIFRMLSRLEILSLLVLFNKSLVLVNGVHAKYPNTL